MSLEQIQEWLLHYPYLGAALLFLLSGMGLPLPEEIVLLAAGYVCAKLPESATLGLMMAWCAGSILCGDLLPFVLGRVFGTRLLRLRWMRILVNKRRLATFDRWFRRRGDAVILIARFIAGLRMVAFFTAGTMGMAWRRFLLLDGLGIALIVPLMIWLGYTSQGLIDEVIDNITRVERELLWGLLAVTAMLAIWFWLYRRRKRWRRRRGTGEAYVQPSRPVQPAPETQKTAVTESATPPVPPVPPDAPGSAPGAAEEPGR